MVKRRKFILHLSGVMFDFMVICTSRYLYACYVNNRISAFNESFMRGSAAFPQYIDRVYGQLRNDEFVASEVRSQSPLNSYN